METIPNRADRELHNLALAQEYAKKYANESPENIATALGIDLEVYTRLKVAHELVELFHRKLNKTNLAALQYVDDFSHHTQPSWKPSSSFDDE